MTNKISSETAAHTLRISQSLIEKTRLEIMQAISNDIIHSFCDSEKRFETDASILFFTSHGVSFGCYFPCDIECKLVNIPLARKDVDVYRNYCNSLFEIYEAENDCWQDSEQKRFIRIFLDTDENSYMLSVMDMADDVLEEPDSDGVD